MITHFFLTTPVLHYLLLPTLGIIPRSLRWTVFVRISIIGLQLHFHLH
jgi:hypothetical protein